MTDPRFPALDLGGAAVPPPEVPASGPVAVWDPLIRISHWGIALVVVVNAVLTKGGGWLHVSLGWSALALLLLRLIWGIFGPWEARFSSFPPNPMAALRHVGQLIKGKPQHYGSHNPAGAMMVYALWASLSVVVFTGLIMTDFTTPMAQAQREAVVAEGDWASLAKASEDDGEGEGRFEVLGEVHEIFGNLMLVLAFLHVAGVFVEGRAMRRNLVAPMLFGAKEKDRAA